MAKRSENQSIDVKAQLESQREKIRALVEASGMTPAKLSRAIGRGKDYIADVLTGRKDTISSSDLVALMQIVESGRTETAPQLQKSGRIPIYAAAEGGHGCMVVQTDPVDYVARPWYFEHVPDAYGVLVIGESMSPAFEPGDIAMVNPRLPALRGKDALFIASEDEGDFRAAIKRFKRVTTSDFIAEQFNPPKEVRLPRREWKKACRIVGRYSGS